MDHVAVLRAWEDNYVYLFRYHDRQALVVDPADDKMVLRALQAAGLELTHVLVTHHHWDHIAGIEPLKHKTGCTIVGPDGSRIPQLDQLVGHGDRLRLRSCPIEIIATPGHTRTSVCYYSESEGGQAGRLWTGDTLFMGGCGRLFECSADDMWQSLERIARLPDNTWIYGGHDYAQENYRFALSIVPHDRAISRRLQELSDPDPSGAGPMPTSLAQERCTNVFLRSASAELHAALGMAQAEPKSVFAELRARKDRF